MSTTQDERPASIAEPNPEGDALIERIHTLPEAEALRCYARLTPRWQWIARQRTTGPRRTALIMHHIASIMGRQ
jgi:hypothetical protein